ncbi:sulfite exporter TauE/SafE family protein [Parafilimonas sp.]|uniref:sulfite exporter TauE/SafE family protein n=1 Tax=Parafilimonas sp. TaxID=1969739 RepID=UPI0039E6A18E
MHIAGYIASLFIGISLGLTGGGGSILTVPVLVYLFGVSPILATSYSLFIVGSTSLIGAFNNWRKNLVDFRTTLLFGISSIITVFIIRKLIIPNIPEHIIMGSFSFKFSVLTMILFGILMLAASFSMMTNKVTDHHSYGKKHIGVLILYGTGIGLVTGFLGAGGGFLLIPALVLLLHLPMKKAIGTSLLIIALNSLMGFAGDIGHHKTDWLFLLTVSAMAVAGIFIGGLFSKKIDGEKLKKVFGWFVLTMGIYIIFREALFS